MIRIRKVKRRRSSKNRKKRKTRKRIRRKIKNIKAQNPKKRQLFQKNRLVVSLKECRFTKRKPLTRNDFLLTIIYNI